MHLDARWHGRIVRVDERDASGSASIESRRIRRTHSSDSTRRGSCDVVLVARIGLRAPHRTRRHRPGTRGGRRALRPRTDAARRRSLAGSAAVVRLIKHRHLGVLFVVPPCARRVAVINARSTKCILVPRGGSPPRPASVPCPSGLVHAVPTRGSSRSAFGRGRDPLHRRTRHARRASRFREAARGDHGPRTRRPGGPRRATPRLTVPAAGDVPVASLVTRTRDGHALWVSGRESGVVIVVVRAARARRASVAAGRRDAEQGDRSRRHTPRARAPPRGPAARGCTFASSCGERDPVQRRRRRDVRARGCRRRDAACQRLRRAGALLRR